MKGVFAMCRRLIVLLALPTLSVVASRSLAWEVVPWGGTDPNGYVVNTQQKAVTIIASGLYQFYVTDNGQLADLRHLDVQPETGRADAVVSIARDPNQGGGAGCVNLGTTSIGGGSTLTLSSCHLAGSIGTLYPVVVSTVSGPVHVEGGVVHDWYVLGDVDGPVQVDGATYGFTTYGSVHAPLTLTGPSDTVVIQGSLEDDLVCGDSVEALSISHATSGAQIRISGNLAVLELPRGAPSVTSIGGNVTDWFLLGTLTGAVAGDVSVAGDVYGDCYLPEVVSGDVSIGGRLTGTIVTSGAQYSNSGVSGDWFINEIGGPGVTFGNGGDPNFNVVSGSVVVGKVSEGSIVVHGRLDDTSGIGSGGHIRILETLGVDEDQAASIDVAKPFPGANEYVTVDWTGAFIGQAWRSGSTITVAGTTYYGSTPGEKVFEASDCKGDMNDDLDVDFADVDPFIAALFDGSGYDTTYPGLSGSRIFHGDFTGDSYIDYADIDPFVARLFQPCSSQGGYLEEDNLIGGGGQEEQMMSGDGAALLAAQLAANVSAEHMGILLDAVTELAANPPDGAVVAWDEVLASLANQ